MLKAVVLVEHLATRGALRQCGYMKDGRQIHATRLPVIHRARHIQHLSVADGVIERPEAQRREDLTNLLGDVLKERLDELGLPGEPIA